MIVDELWRSQLEVLNLKNDFIKKMKLVTKITRGLYSGDYSNDIEYIKFCNTSIDRFITEKGEDLWTRKKDCTHQRLTPYLSDPPVPFQRKQPS